MPARIRAEIHRRGPLPFPDFMAAALYDPDQGYYARGVRQVGRGGDFFTSVSTGPLFGQLLARRFLREWEISGSPARWRIIECGAHDGTLAADVLAAIRTLSPAAFSALEYVIPEPLPRLRAAQWETLAPFPGRVRILPDLAEIEPLPGVAFGNELLDALPFHVVTREGGNWRECRVATGPDDRFIWENADPVPALTPALAAIGDDFPDGYRTEIRTCFESFFRPLLRALDRGLLLWPDYGFARPEYYDPARKSGTLRTFSRHRAGDDPLAAPGEIDITAHVDFTAAAEAAIALGCRPLEFHNQGAWLTRIARDWLLSLEGNPDPAALRQFQTLVHPAHLGGSFHVLELAWNQPAAAAPAPEIHHRLGLPGPP